MKCRNVIFIAVLIFSGNALFCGEGLFGFEREQLFNKAQSVKISLNNKVKDPKFWDFVAGCSLLVTFRKHISWANAGKLAVASYLGNLFVPIRVKRVVADVPLVRQMLNCKYLRSEDPRGLAYDHGIMHTIVHFMRKNLCALKNLWVEHNTDEE